MCWVVVVFAAWSYALSTLHVVRPRRLGPRRIEMMGRGVSPMLGRHPDESRRQARFAQLVRVELASLVRDGTRKIKTNDRVSPEILQSTSVIDVQISSDLQTAIATVTTRGNVAAKREAYVWLVNNAKSIRYALARRLSHTKRIPDITFRKADVSAATQLMNLIDGVNGSEDDAPSGLIDGLDFDFEDLEDDVLDDYDADLD
ncbi:hypothetical protein CTAYLR_009719 [Chrysophaeum taylorii]|uniref:Ribosome-binding factor A n=1 Tax=Chrysophaeum taylorii TaxID=2483200 RepID=A0AAD7UG11_9STRA|nr:hypothetical protein CTAYLR_009719 [Chrysophaeum taylorii]